MISRVWRKLFSALKRLCLYPPPKPMQRTRLFWLSMALVTCFVIAFCVYFIALLLARQNAFLTNAEDFGIADQAVWSILHGLMPHQTICNIVNDTNCAGLDGTTRFAIHVEPILFPISLLYLIWPDPKVLVVLQTLIVASGAYPAFWLARLRLRNDLASVVIAVVYLLYPGQQQATTYDFHAVTFTAALLLFTLYFMYTRRTGLLFIFAILSMACKEEIPLVVAMFGLWSIIFQQRWRSGLALIVLSAIWFIVAFKVVIPHFSPSGHQLLISRWDDVLKDPGQFVLNALRHPKTFLNQYVWENGHFNYLQALFSPVGGIPLGQRYTPLYLLYLAPWVLVMALPSIALNLLSSDPQMYSGLFQYSAEIVPVLIFTTIESILVAFWLIRIMLIWLRKLKRKVPHADALPYFARPWSTKRLVYRGFLSVLLVGILCFALRSDYYFHGQMPFSIGFSWPQVTAHTILAQRFIDMIPADASVSAQSKLVPHISQRSKIYLFPYGDSSADYIFLDVTSDSYPYYGSSPYISEVKSVLLNGKYGVVAAQDGYLLLKRGLPPPGISPYPTPQPVQNMEVAQVLPRLPSAFCSNVYATPKEITHPLQVAFSDANSNGKINLVGYNVSAARTLSRSSSYIGVTTYWQVTSSIMSPLQIALFMKGHDGKEYLASTDFPTFFWCPSNTWKPGAIVRVVSGESFNLESSQVPNGLAYMSIALLPLAQSSSKIMDVQVRLPLHIVRSPARISLTQGKNALQLMPYTIVQ